MITLRVLFVSVLLTVYASGQSLLQAPQPQPRFWTKEQIALTIADGGAKGTDAYYTHWNMAQRHCQELDSFARPFVTHGTAMQIAFFGGLWAADQGESYLDYKYGKHRGMRGLRYAPLIYGVYANTRGAMYSASHRK